MAINGIEPTDSEVVSSERGESTAKKEFRVWCQETEILNKPYFLNYPETEVLAGYVDSSPTRLVTTTIERSRPEYDKRLTPFKVIHRNYYQARHHIPSEPQADNREYDFFSADDLVFRVDPKTDKITDLRIGMNGERIPSADMEAHDFYNSIVVDPEANTLHATIEIPSKGASRGVIGINTMYEQGYLDSGSVGLPSGESFALVPDEVGYEYLYGDREGDITVVPQEQVGENQLIDEIGNFQAVRTKSEGHYVVEIYRKDGADGKGVLSHRVIIPLAPKLDELRKRITDADTGTEYLSRSPQEDLSWRGSSPQQLLTYAGIVIETDLDYTSQRRRELSGDELRNIRNQLDDEK